MEEEKKKRKGYKTQEQQNAANKRYRNTEHGKAKTKYLNYKSRARVFINDLATDEDLKEFKSLINSKLEEK